MKIAQTDHRPWPVPARLWAMAMRWRDLPGANPLAHFARRLDAVAWTLEDVA